MEQKIAWMPEAGGLGLVGKPGGYGLVARGGGVGLIKGYCTIQADFC